MKKSVRKKAGGRKSMAIPNGRTRPKMTVDVHGNTGVYTAMGYRSIAVAEREGRGRTGGAGRWWSSPSREKLCHQARDFQRNNGIFQGMINRAVSYIIANGFGLQGLSKSKTWNDTLEGLWKEEWKRPEIKGVLSGPRTERMVCRELLTVGDTGAILLDTGKIQQIESEQITSRTFPDGIETNESGTPTKFWISPYGARGQVQKNKAKEYIPDEEFLFLTDPDRPSGLRAMPPMQASFSMLHRINDVCNSEAIAWQILARLAVSITRPGGPQAGRKESRPNPNKASGDLAGDLATRITELGYAMIFHGQPGDEVKGIDRNIPGRSFSDSIIMFLRLLGLPLGLPLEIVLLDWTKSNYSQSRAVLEQAFETFIGWQQLIIDFFHNPVLAWKIARWISQGRLKDRKDIVYGWILPTFPWIDQLKEAQAQGAKIDRAFTTHSAVCKSLNMERDVVVAKRVEEVLDAIKKAQGIEDQTGVKVPWQIFAGLEIPGRATNVMATAALGEEEKTPAPPAINEEEKPDGE